MDVNRVEDQVVLKKDGVIVDRMDPEDAFKMANELHTHAAKALEHSNKEEA